MKSCFRKTLVLSVSAAAGLWFVPIRANAQSMTTIPIPEDSSMACTEAIDSVEAELVNKGFFSPWEGEVGGRMMRVTPEIDISADHIQKAYHGYPMNRPHSVSFGLSGEFRKVDTLLNSPQLLSILSARIMADCYQVGLVQFNHWWEGGVPVGYYPDDTARPFTGVTWGRVPGFVSEDDIDIRTIETEEGARRVYPWGYYFFI